MKMNEIPVQEIWVEAVGGQSLCALVHGDRGWLMYLRSNGDAGFSSRNPLYDGPPEAMVEYRLNSGQIDAYPASWALPLSLVTHALKYFKEHKKPPAFIQWHNVLGKQP